MLYENKDEIKSRMIRNAAKIWGYSGISSENDFDPLVSLLLNVTAAEIEKLSGEIHASRARVLERMIQIMTPDLITTPLPAHAIMHSISNDEADIIKAEEQFLLHNDDASVNKDLRFTKSLYFTPTGNFNINKSNIAFIAAGNCLFQYDNKINKDLVEISPNNISMPESTLWLGITEPDIYVHNIQFFFSADLPSEKQIFYSQLANAVWYDRDNNVLPVTQGYGFDIYDSQDLDLQEILEERININKTVIKGINDFYRQQFITLHKKVAGKKSIDLPIEIEKNFSQKAIQLLKGQPLYWIRINFPEQISNRLLQDVNCYINCFPVLNKHVYEQTYELNDLVNIIPLNTDELFFDLGEVSSQNGEQLRVRDLEGSDKDIQVILRHGGVGRFDERDAQAAIENIIQLLRDDGASFAAIGKNFVASEVKTLQQIINKLEQQITKKNTLNSSSAPHLLISGGKKEKKKSVFVTYWGTVGNDGNGIRSGTHVIPHRSNTVNHHESYFITATVGGRGHLSPNDKIAAYKNALLSRNRIISSEDIRLFCKLHLGQGLREVIIEKGIQIAHDLSKGYTKTIDIKLVLTKMAYVTMIENNETDYWKDFLYQELAQRSQTFLPFRIFIECGI